MPNAYYSEYKNDTIANSTEYRAIYDYHGLNPISRILI